MTTTQEKQAKPKTVASSITVRFAGDSGDGMQLTGDQFTDTTAVMGNDFSTLPEYPAEIRAPAGTLPGVSSFQIQFSDSVIFTPGDQADVLVAMNPAALKVNLKHIKKGGLMVVNEDAFTEADLTRAAWTANPLNDNTLKDWHVLKVKLTELTMNALKDSPLRSSEKERCKNFFALGMMFWLYDRTLEHTVKWIQDKFTKKPEIAAANIAVLKAGYYFADITEAMPSQVMVKPTKLEPGTYRKITGNDALAIGLVAAAKLAGKTLFYGTYPITPASSILEFLAKQKHFGVKTFQAEDEIAAIGSAIGAAFGGALAVTGTSGPGLCLKSEALNLAVMTELPLVVIDVQRSGPSTGMPTKTEQTDLLQAMFGRNGESPVVVIAPKTPSDCFEAAVEACRIAIEHMVPVVLLSEGYLANSHEPWKLPDIDALAPIRANHPPLEPGKKFLPYSRDPKTLARPWAVPGMPGMEHRIGGLSKAENTGNVSYDPDNNEKMIRLRAEKVARVADVLPPLSVRGPAAGKLLVLGWGSTYGAIHQAVSDLTSEGKTLSQAHLTHMNPFPKNLGDVLSKFERIMVPETNSGQLLMLLRHNFPGLNFTGYNRTRGIPFFVAELRDEISKLL
jgi:2-oxoglutarate/2-oxoacid ferredoxin oxidoreductase subunit alpha